MKKKTKRKRKAKIKPKQFKGSVNEFIKKISTKKGVAFLKKLRGKKLNFWWEDKERWFVNNSEDFRGKEKTGGWYIAPDLPQIIEKYIRKGYVMYVNKK